MATLGFDRITEVPVHRPAQCCCNFRRVRIHVQPTILDQIKNFHPLVQVGGLSRGTCQPFSLRLPSTAGKAVGCLSLD